MALLGSRRPPALASGLCSTDRLPRGGEPGLRAQTVPPPSHARGGQGGGLSAPQKLHPTRAPFAPPTAGRTDGKRGAPSQHTFTLTAFSPRTQRPLSSKRRRSRGFLKNFYFRNCLSGLSIFPLSEGTTPPFPGTLTRGHRPDGASKGFACGGRLHAVGSGGVYFPGLTNLGKKVLRNHPVSQIKKTRSIKSGETHEHKLCMYLCP